MPHPNTPEGRGKKERGSSHLWIPRGLGDAAILLALAADREEGCPDNVSALARMLGVTRDRVRDLRQQLAGRSPGEALVERRGGFLVATALGRAAIQAGSDPLPRALLRGPGERPTMAMLRAAALIYADAIGYRSDRHGCRSDSERAKLAGTSRRLIVAARKLLDALQLIKVEKLRRGRADLRRARLTADRRATHGSPMSATRAKRLALLAEHGRRRRARGGDGGNSEGGDQRHRPLQLREPKQAPMAPIRPGTAPSEQGSACGREQDRWLSGARSFAELLRIAVPTSASAQEADARDRQAVAAAVHADLSRLAASPGAIARLFTSAPAVAHQQVLELARVHDAAPKQRAGLAVRLVRVLHPLQHLMLLCDVVLAGKRVRTVPGVMLTRLRRLLQGDKAVLTHARSAWTPQDFLQQFGAARPEVASQAFVAPSMATHHPAGAAIATTSPSFEAFARDRGVPCPQSRRRA